MKIGLLVEGPTDKEAIPILIRKVIGQGVGIVSRVCPRGDLLNAKKIKAYLDYDLMQETNELSKVFICMDSECTDPKDIEEQAQAVKRRLIRAGMQRPIEYCVVVHALESWLMSDIEALRKFLGMTNLRLQKPENICKPKATMKEIFRKAGRDDYQPTHHNPTIAERVDVKRIAQHNSSFAKFCKLITAS